VLFRDGRHRQPIFRIALATFRRKNSAPRRGDFISCAGHFLRDRTVI
jgi:ribosomal protein S16